MRALVTGGAGFIGSHLVDALRANGHQVWVLDDLSVGQASSIGQHLGQEDFHFICDSILDEALVDELVSQVDLVYHLAAAVGVRHIVRDPLRAILTNVRGTENVLTAAARHWRRVVIASSSEIYGRSEGGPLAEERDRVLGPTTVTRWSYSASKAIDEHLAWAYHDRGLPVSVVRYFNCYGPRLNEDGYGSVVANFIRQALCREPITVHSDGRQTRSFTYVGDTVAGTMLAGERQEARGEVFNIGNPAETTILDLAHLVKELTGSSSAIVHVPYEDCYGQRHEDTPRRCPDITKAYSLLGFRPRVPLREGLQRTIAWCRDHYQLRLPRTLVVSADGLMDRALRSSAQEARAPDEARDGSAPPRITAAGDHAPSR
jgi:UDP-glucose 4-epimerase